MGPGPDGTNHGREGQKAAKSFAPEAKSFAPSKAMSTRLIKELTDSGAHRLGTHRAHSSLIRELADQELTDSGAHRFGSSPIRELADLRAGCRPAAGPGSASLGHGPGFASLGRGPGFASLGRGPGSASLGHGPGFASLGRGAPPAQPFGPVLSIPSIMVYSRLGILRTRYSRYTQGWLTPRTIMVQVCSCFSCPYLFMVLRWRNRSGHDEKPRSGPAAR